MADLLECLIQIKGVGDTPRRLTCRVEDAFERASSREAVVDLARAVAARLATAELRFGECLSLMLSHDRPTLPTVVAAGPDGPLSGTPADWQGRFAERRAGTLQVLESCSAEQLNRIGIEPSRGPMTVADLVALMLAHDTDTLGELIDNRLGR